MSKTDTLEIDLADILESKYPRGIHAPVDFDIADFLAADDSIHELDLHELLAEDRRVALVYSLDDVKGVRPDLDDDQAWDVLQQFEAACQDCPEPLHETIRQLADMAYPNSKALFRERLDRLAREVEALPGRQRDDPAGYGAAAAKIDTLETQVKGA